MFRLGSFLFIPSYLTVILYRVFASDKDDGNLVLMSGTSPLQARNLRPTPCLTLSSLTALALSTYVIPSMRDCCAVETDEHH